MTQENFWAGSRLEQAMAQKGVSANALSKKTGILRSSISSYINEKSVPGANTVAALSDGLGVPVGYFFVEKFVSVQTDTNEGSA